MTDNFKIYVHISPSKKLYVGLTKTKPQERWGKNGENYRSQTLFWRAIQKYGWDNFQHIVLLDGLSKEEACECEKYLISKYQTNNSKFGYNLTLGGDGTFGYVFTDEQRRQVSERMKGHPTSEETRRKIGEANRIALKGRKLSPELRKQISERNKGVKHPHTAEQDRLQSERLKGNKLHLGYKVSEESRKRMSLAHKGQKPSEETRRKLSEANKKYYENVDTEKEYLRRKKIGDGHRGKKKPAWSDEARKAHMEAIERRRKEKLQNANSGLCELGT